MDPTFVKLALGAKYLSIENWRNRYEQDLFNQWNELKRHLSREEELPRFVDWYKKHYQQCLEYLHDKELY